MATSEKRTGRQTDVSSANQAQDTSSSATGLPGEAMVGAPKESYTPPAIPKGRVVLINRLPQKLVLNARDANGGTQSVEIPALSQIEFTGHEDGDLGPDVPVKIRRGHLQAVPVTPTPEKSNQSEDR